MEETLKSLSEYQIEALRKGISFDIDLTIGGDNVPSATVRMNYSVTGDISKGFVFTTTISKHDSCKKRKLANIGHFISTVTTEI